VISVLDEVKPGVLEMSYWLDETSGIDNNVLSGATVEPTSNFSQVRLVKVILQDGDIGNYLA